MNLRLSDFWLVRAEPVSSFGNSVMPGAGESRWTNRKEGGDPRYAISMPLEYQLLHRRGPAARGGGKTINLSRTEVLFESQGILQIGCRIKLFIDWPRRLDDRYHLVLFVTGRTVRVSGTSSAVAILKHRFVRKGSIGQNATDDTVPSPS